MRKRHIIILLAVLTVTLSALGGQRRHRLPARSSADLHARAWVTVTDTTVLSNLRGAGVSVETRFGTLATVSIPASRLEKLLAMGNVRSVSRPTIVELHNDVALQLSRGTAVAEGSDVTTGDTLSCTGRGVVFGIIDSGFDFGHINFRDADGNCRIAAAYLPADTTGTRPVIDGDTLPGSAYYGAEVETLTTDAASMSHATHTTGTAAGSHGTYRGVAPGATIVACGMPENELTDANIAAGLRFIADYAERHDMPMVISMSLGSADGAHDGTSPLSRVIDDIVSPGRLCVVSAGNQGEVPCHIRKTFAGQGDTLRTFFSNWSGGSSYGGFVSSWSQTAVPHDITLAVIDLTTDTVCLKIPLADFPLDGEGTATLDSEENADWARYFTGVMQWESATDDNGRYNTLIAFDVDAADYNRYALGMLYTSNSAQTIEMWCSGMCFWNRSLSGWTTGTSTGSISDMATGDKVISVGAYCSRKTTPKADGTQMSFSRCKPYGIAYFSSFGPDARGIARPDITAPGFAIVSSANRYDSVSSIYRRLALMENVGGVDYPYGVEYGTSMSTPVVSGAIAVWLQACPTLSHDDVRYIFAETAYLDSYVSDNGRWGAGKLDIAAGLRLARVVNFDVNRDREVNAADVSAIYEALLLGSASRQADVNHDRTVNAADISALYHFLINDLQEL